MILGSLSNQSNSTYLLRVASECLQVLMVRFVRDASYCVFSQQGPAEEVGQEVGQVGKW